VFAGGWLSLPSRLAGTAPSGWFWQGAEGAAGTGNESEQRIGK